MNALPVPPGLSAEEVLRWELRDELLHLPYGAFAECIRLLLVSLGYNEVQSLTRTHWRQRTGHGGFDMEATASIGVTKGLVIVQAKQYSRPVQRRFVDELRGTMLRHSARHGLLVTTSTFPDGAVRAGATDPVLPIRLIDGEELFRLMCRHEVGVQGKPPNQRLDRLFFNALRRSYPGSQRGRGPKKPTGGASAISAASVPVVTVTLSGGDMMFRTHALFAMNSLWLLQAMPPGLPPERIGLMAVVAVFGAMLPDLDASDSKIKRLEVGGIAPFVPVSWAAHRFFGHRGLLHSLAGLMLCGLLASALVPAWGGLLSVSLWLGYLSHLIADACTRSGIPLWPGKGRRIHLLPKGLRFVTGSYAEDMLLPVLAGFALLLLFHGFVE